MLADQVIPCDILLLHAETENGNCNVTTANLDGETNLKIKSAPNGLLAEFGGGHDEQSLSNLRFTIQCEKPNARLYEFKGKLTLTSGRDIPIGNDNVLLRGCCLRLAPVIYGCAIYTGQDTKMMRNMKFKSNKLSCIERFVASSVSSILRSPPRINLALFSNAGK